MSFSSFAGIGPAARKIAAERGIDLTQIQGSGTEGRILKADVRGTTIAPQSEDQAYFQESAPAPQAEETDLTSEEQAEVSALPECDTAPITLAVPQIIETAQNEPVVVRHTSDTNKAPFLSVFDEVDMFRVLALCAEHRDSFLNRHGVELGALPFFIRATVLALYDFPALAIEEAKSAIGFSRIMASGANVYPVIQDITHKSLADIARETARLSAAANNETLGPNDLGEAGFVIADAGLYKAMLSAPAINPPHHCTLGLHTIKERAVVINGAIEAHPVMYIAASFDSAQIDARTATRFLQRIKEMVENPERLLLAV